MINKLRAVGTFVLLLEISSQGLRADVVKIAFGATIEESSFVTPGYRVGDVVTGWFSYNTDNHVELKPNHTAYRRAGKPEPPTAISFGSTTYESRWNSVFVYNSFTSAEFHDPAYHSTSPVDLYTHSSELKGPSPEGFDPYCSWWILADTDNAFYDTTLPYPIDPPDPKHFETQEFLALFLADGPDSKKALERYIRARIDYLSGGKGVSYQRAPDSGSSLCLLAASIGLVALVRRLSAQLTDSNLLF